MAGQASGASGGKRQLLWSVEQVFAFLEREFPQAFLDGDSYTLERLEPGGASVRLTATERNLRPGGTVSGPAMMKLVDFSVYALLLAHHGVEARLAVTSNLSISFLRKPGPGDIVCDVELVKHGRTLSVADCRLRSGDGRLVAHAEATYYMGGSGES
ncbi:MAG: PaaI family thioesterase [Parvibaculaceae bacterium]